MDSLGFKDEFLKIYQREITRPGANDLLSYITSEASDFFTAPASTRFHGSHEGGLVEHSLNVYRCLKEYLSRPFIDELFGQKYSDETVAIVSLLHDLCKINCYKVSSRNVKDENGNWTKVPFYEFDDQLPYGHGEKSVYIISGFMRLTREEAFAIRYHMGFSAGDDMRNVSKAFESFPLSFALSTADMEASYFLES